MSETVELLPCPLCGETLEIRTGANPYGRHGKDSDCLLAGRAINIPSDVERWNRRPSPPPAVREGEALAKLDREINEAAITAAGGSDNHLIAHVDAIRSLLAEERALRSSPTPMGEAVAMKAKRLLHPFAAVGLLLTDADGWSDEDTIVITTEEMEHSLATVKAGIFREAALLEYGSEATALNPKANHD